jgi:GT2 family glycosyltransferase
LRANGKYIAFLDGDDYWGPDHLAKQIAMLQQNPAFDLAYCDSVLVKDERPFARVFSMEPQSPEVTFESLLTEDCAVGTSSAVASRAALIRAGLFDESFRRCEDFDMWLRMAFAGARITFHPDAQVYHRISGASLSADRWSMKKDRIRVYQKIASMLPVSEEQTRIIRTMVAQTEAQCDVQRLKEALKKGDYSRATEAATRANALEDNWKVKLALLGLRTAPGFFRRVYLARTWLMDRARLSRRTASPPD